MVFDEKGKGADKRNEDKEKKESDPKLGDGKEKSKYVLGSKEISDETIHDTEADLADLKVNIEIDTDLDETGNTTEKLAGGTDDIEQQSKTSKGEGNVVYTQTKKGFVYNPSNARMERVRADLNPDEGRKESAGYVEDMAQRAMSIRTLWKDISFFG